MILDTKINFPIHVFGFEANNVSIKIEDPYNLQGAILVTLLLDGKKLYQEFPIELYLDQDEDSLEDSIVIDGIKEWFDFDRVEHRSIS